MEIIKIFSPELLKGKTVFITGGGSGINFGIAQNFAAVGANLAICGRTEEKLHAAREKLEKLGAKVSTTAADVRDYDAVTKALENAKKELGPVSVLINGAAGNFPCPAEQLTPNGFKSVIDIDLLGSFNTTRAAFEQLKETKGSIIFISAGQAMIPYPLQAHVGAAKAGIDNLMRNLAMEWGRFGIRSNSVAPGPIEGTEGVERLIPSGQREKLTKLIPLQRLGTVNDIGQLCVFLATPLASYITGTLIVADGGQNLPGAGVLIQALMEGVKH